MRMDYKQIRFTHLYGIKKAPIAMMMFYLTFMSLGGLQTNTLYEHTKVIKKSNCNDDVLIESRVEKIFIFIHN